VTVLFTIPYLAIQAIGAGILIEYVSGNINWQIGAIFTVLIISVYVSIGGMRASGWTDFFQGIIMILSLTIAVIFISSNLGGFENANILAYSVKPDLFTRPGLNGYFTPSIWFSFMILWIFAGPMFPQIFSRFYTAKNQDAIKKSMILYPLVVTFLFLMPVLIGVWAHGTGIILPIGQEDYVLPIMVEKYTPYIVYVFVMIGALAALMSTADSQLLSLSTMISHDIHIKKIFKSELTLAKFIILFLAIITIIFVIIGYDPNSGIMGTLVKTTFSGLSVLFPTTIAALYWKKATKYGCIASIIIGELSVLLFYLEIIPSFGFLPAIWSILISSVSLMIFSKITFNLIRK
jgi:SSS family solute:Na+ symporter